MRLVVSVAVLAALVLPASAAEKKTFNLSMNEIVSIGNSLLAMDGADKIVKVKDETAPNSAQAEVEKIVKQPYKFSGSVLLAMAKDISVIRLTLTDFQEAVKKAKVADTSKDEIEKMATLKQDIELVPLPAKDLNLDQNQIPASVIGSLFPIIEE